MWDFYCPRTGNAYDSEGLFMFSWLLTGALAEAEETAEAAVSEPSWFETAVKKLVETPLTVWIAILVLVALGAVLLAVTRTSRNWNAQMLSFAALSVALSFVLSCIRLYRMPQGGSVTPASMLPLMLFSAAFGIGPGLLAGLVYGILQYLQGGWFLNVWQFALDYLLAFAALGLTGMARKLPEKWGLYFAMLVAVIGRALSATLAGIMFWDTAPLASLIYNGTYLIPEVVICMILAAAIAKPVMRIMKAGTR